LRHVRDHGALPPELYSKEEQNAVGESGVGDAEVQRHRDAVVSWLGGSATLPESVDVVTICILDGFLLYSDPATRSIPQSVTDLLDVKLFLRSNYARTKARREARKGYVTLESFWEDPEGYVDEVVWPNYIAAHKWMFEDGDVDGEVVEKVREEGILVAPGKGERSIGELLAWCVETMEREIGRILREPET
jgi:nicotinamide/nicotinate riboside kinase